MELSGKWPVAALCREMSVNRSGFYKFRARCERPSERQRKRAADIGLSLGYHSLYPSHGYRWLNAKISLDLGLAMSDEYARRCCAYAGVRSVSKHYRYKKGGPSPKSYPNLILASLDITGPVQVVASDMTAFWAGGKYWELTLYTDLWNNEIISYGLKARKGDRDGYFEGLSGFLELKKKYPGMETIFHADHGSVYSSKAFNELLLPYDITRTMPGPGTPTQNGAMESIDGWVKTELFTDLDIRESGDVPSQTRDCIRFFNEERPMCCLGYMTPRQYKEEYLSKLGGSPLPRTCLRLPAKLST